MALNGLFCAEVPLRNYSLTYSLINKLTALQLPPLVLSWIISFLRDRTQVCKVGDAESQINRGIIHRSGLGPTLFTVMESDLYPKSSKNIIVKFANDTTLVVPENSDVFLPKEFDHINVWVTVNKKTLSLIKTKEIVFHRPGPKKLLMFPSVESTELVKQAKLLGVILQNNFSVNFHVN